MVGVAHESHLADPDSLRMCSHFRHEADFAETCNGRGHMCLPDLDHEVGKDLPMPLDHISDTFRTRSVFGKLPFNLKTFRAGSQPRSDDKDSLAMLLQIAVKIRPQSRFDRDMLTNPEFAPSLH